MTGTSVSSATSSGLRRGPTAGEGTDYDHIKVLGSDCGRSAHGLFFKADLSP